jgi:putative DNA primase/helicase
MRDTVGAARGKWKGVLLSLGIDRKHLTGKHGPCPHCGGTDRFRFDNKDGAGTWFCSHCGAGIGIDLLKLVKGWDFGTAAREVDRVLGRVEKDAPGKPAVPPERRRELLNALWMVARPLQAGCAATAYLTGRIGYLASDLSDLRFHPAARLPQNLGEGNAPALLALVRDTAGKPVSIHRTFLDDKGGKIGRALMPGQLPDSIAIRLGLPDRGHLAIAEGLETALAVTQSFNVPCWATVTAGFMAKWEPPEGVQSVAIYGDADHSYTGQAAAYACAQRLVAKGLRVVVHIPRELGLDYADG